MHDLLTGATADEAHRRARALGIQYLWVDQDDGPAGASAVERFAGRPDLFRVPYRRGGVAVVHVL